MNNNNSNNMSISIILMDGVDGETYTLNVTRDEANRINTGIIRVNQIFELILNSI